MDPDATLKALIDAVVDGDEQQVSILADALKHWLDRGGFAPTTIGPRTLGNAWHTAITRTICEIAVAFVEPSTSGD